MNLCVSISLCIDLCVLTHLNYTFTLCSQLLFHWIISVWCFLSVFEPSFLFLNNSSYLSTMTRTTMRQKNLNVDKW